MLLGSLIKPANLYVLHPAEKTFRFGTMAITINGLASLKCEIFTAAHHENSNKFKLFALLLSLHEVVLRTGDRELVRLKYKYLVLGS